MVKNRKKIVEALATGFYVGKVPFMPGTFGTLLGIPLVWLFVQASALFYMAASIGLLVLAAVVAEMHERFSKEHDASEIVIDEVVGYVIAMTWLPLNWQSLLAAFVLFRLFDIWKPFPIGHIDRKITGGLGTVLDDVAAGLVVNVILQIVYTKTNWLGEQLYVALQ